jgi:hypothetical protein
MTPIRLSDEELAAVFNAARPLAVDRRDAFLQLVADELARLNGSHGPGDVYRAIRAAQRVYFDPPIIPNGGRPPVRGKYR